MIRTIDEYLATVPERDREALEDLRRTIRAAAPMATETITYRIPCFSWHGPLVFFAAFRDHLSLYIVDKSILERFRTGLVSFHTSGTTIHFSAEHPLPASLVTAIVKMRIEENLAKQKK